MSNIRDIIKDKFEYLKTCGIDTSISEVKMLLADVLNTDTGNLRFYNKNLTPDELSKFDKYINLRKDFWPVDKILGKKSFYKLEFEVNQDVLSPRYDTEILIDEAIKLFNPDEKIDILELGTGSGCIVISLLNEYKNARAVGIDISEKALIITKTNAIKNQVDDRLSLLHAGWFDNDITEKINKKFDIIISNPPYIPSADIQKLDNEVKNFDPLLALDGGTDGLRDYKRICSLAESLLKEDGYLIFEAGINQAHDIAEIGVQNRLKLVKISNDLNGIERCVILKK